MGETRILYCNCTYAQVIPPGIKAEVLDGLACSGGSFETVADLCELSARKDPALARLAAGDGALRIAACYPRAVRWLFHAAGAPLPENNVTVLNMRDSAAGDVLRGLLEASPDGEAAS